MIASRSGTQPGMTKGTVTFLDVLGWKGIWLRRGSTEVVSDLQRLVSLAKDRARGTTTTVLSISDTIVLMTEEDSTSGLRIHGELASEILCESIVLGLPVRGATSYGEFFHDRNSSILVGAAVDEAASWHEVVDWIGVVQTPSAFLVHDGSSPWRTWAPPVKVPGKWNIPCLDWPPRWVEKGLKNRELRQHFSAMGPFDTKIAAKYANTLEFFANSQSEPPAA